MNVLEYLEWAAVKYPNKPAFVDEQNTLTFSQTLRTAQAVGSRLSGIVKPGSPVAVLLDRCALAPACYLGVVFSGGFYVPLDPQLPEYRLRLILQTVAAQVILTDTANAAQVYRTVPNACVLLVEEAVNGDIDASALAKIRSEATDNQPLYAIFTSGSTGVPKGVLVSHHSVINFIEQFTATFELGADDIFGNQAPFDFDISVKDIYSTLKCGATLCIIPRLYFSFPLKLVEFLNSHRVTTIIWAVSALSMVASLKAFEKEVPCYLEKIMFSSEVMPVKHLNTWRRYLPNALYVNLYGPTEITCNCTYYIVQNEAPVDAPLPIGKPFHNTRIQVLNERNQPVQSGEIGELCVLGACLALGYYNNPQRTELAFVQNPLNPYYPERMYRTGDLARYDQENNLIFCGRSDHQIKHMGHRIELGEIETVVNAIDGVYNCCALYDEADRFIYLFYTSDGLPETQVQRELAAKLPKYTRPHRIRTLVNMPINKNGKIDRVRLKQEYLEVKPE